MSLFVQPPPGTFGGTNGLGGADGFGGTGENNVMYAGLTLILFVCVAGFMPLNSAKTFDLPHLDLPNIATGAPKTKVDKMFGFALPPNAREARTQVRSRLCAA